MTDIPVCRVRLGVDCDLGWDKRRAASALSRIEHASPWDSDSDFETAGVIVEAVRLLVVAARAGCAAPSMGRGAATGALSIRLEPSSSGGQCGMSFVRAICTYFQGAQNSGA